MKKHIDLLRTRLLKKQIKKYEIYLMRQRGTTLEFDSGKTKTQMKADEYGFALRLIHAGRLGFSYSSEFNTASIDKTIDLALEAAVYRPVPAFDFASFAPATFNPGRDASLLEIPFQEKIELLFSLETFAKKYDPAIHLVKDLTYSDFLSQVQILNSNGLEVSFENSCASLVLSALAKKHGKEEVGMASQETVFFKDLNPENLGEEAARRALSFLGSKEISPYQGPVIFSSLVVAEMLQILLPSFFASSLVKGTSILKNKKGEKIFSSQINLVDDGLAKKRVGAAPYDAEGVPRKRTPLVTKGYVTHFLSDLFWGEKAGCESTGNAMRENLTLPPEIGFGPVSLEPGEKNKEDLIKDLGRGFIIEETIGMHMADVVSGQFSVGVSGLSVVNGKKGKPFRGGVVTSNIKEVFSKIIEVGNDLKWDSGILAPSILVSQIGIVGS